MIRKMYELTPTDGRKSFYGKARVIELDTGEIICKSYQTDVGAIRGGKFVRTWSGYSATTMRHVNAFLAAFGLPGGGEAWWDSLPVEL